MRPTTLYPQVCFFPTDPLHMSKFYACTVILFCLVCVHDASGQNAANYARYDKDVIVRADITSIRELRTMLALSPDCWSEACGIGTFDFRIPADRMNAFKASKIKHDVLIEDVQVLLDAERVRLNTNQGGIAGVNHFDEYRRTNEIFAHYDGLMMSRPDLMSMEVIGTSIEGREIRRYTITGGDISTVPSIYITALAHAREWIGGATMNFVVNQLVSLHGSDPQVTALVDGIAWQVVAVSNPDGYEYTWDSDRLWRKTRRNNGDGTFGVDWNRNYSAGWGGPGSSGSTNSDTYRGTAPFSEPETAAIRDDLTSLPNVVAFFDVHCYSQLMLWPYGYIQGEPEGQAGVIHRTIGQGIMDTIASVYNTVFVPQPAYDLYQASGTSLDWGWDEAGAYSWTFELRDTGQNGFILPPDQIIPSGEEIFEAFLYVGDQVLGNLSLEWIIQPPALIEAGIKTPLQARLISAFGQLAPDTAQLAYRINAQEVVRTPMAAFGDIYSAALPPAECDDIISYWIEIQTLDGIVLVAQDGDVPYQTVVTTLDTIFFDDAETDLGWTLGVSSDTATTGIWVRADPIGSGAQPEDDASVSGTTCFITGQGSVGGGLGENDVDGGITTLLSPIIDLSALEQPQLSVNIWYSNNLGAEPESDSMLIEISNDLGNSWATLEEYASNQSQWVQRTYELEDIATSNTVQFRFVARDLNGGSIVEAGIDDFSIFSANCPDIECLGDLNLDRTVDGADLGLMLSGWNTSGNTDLNGDGNTDGADLGLLLVSWGPCS